MLSNFGLISFPLRNPNEECGQYFIGQIISFLAPNVHKVHLFTANYDVKPEYANVEIHNNIIPIAIINESVITKLKRLLKTQFLLSFEIFKQRKKFEILMIFIGAPFLVSPIITARLLNKRTVLIVSGSDSKSLKFMYPGRSGQFFAGLVHVAERAVYFLVNNIVIFSESMISDLGLVKYRNKVVSDANGSVLAGSNAFIDINKFKVIREWDKRDDIVGYIGRLSGEKGIKAFVEAIPLLIQKGINTRFLIVGDGPLMPSLKHYLEDNNCLDRVQFAGLRPHSEIPELLNKIRFLVCPSHTEVVSAALLEGMACGVICLATSVGATKDVIVNGETGFILKDNMALTIANQLLEIYDSDQLINIQSNSISFIENNFTKIRILNRWKLIVNKLTER